MTRIVAKAGGRNRCPTLGKLAVGGSLPLVLALMLPAQVQPLIVKGRTVTPDGAPIAAAGVVFGPAARVSAQQALASPHQTGATGEFSLRVDPRSRGSLTNVVLLAAPGHTTVRVTHRLFRHPDDLTPTTVDLGRIVLAPGVDIEGRVRDGRSRPIAGARVWTEDLLSASRSESIEFTTQALGDATGRFVLVGACRKAIRIVVDAPGYYRKTIPFANAIDPMMFILAPSGFVEGRVVEATNRPTPVHLVYDNGEGEDEMTMTDAKGRFRRTKRHPGRCAVVAGSLRRPRARSSWLAGPKAEVEIRIPPGMLQVRVRDAESGSSIKIFRGAITWRGGWPIMSRAFAGGVIHFVPPLEGDSDVGILRVAARGYVPREVLTACPGRNDTLDVAVALERGVAVSGRVFDEGTGKPIAAAKVVCFGSSKNRLRYDWGSEETTRDGHYRISGLAAGSFTLVAWRAGSRVRSVRTFDITSGDKNVDGVDIILTAPTVIRGRVRNTGLLTRGARVVATLRRGLDLYEVAPGAGVWVFDDSSETVHHSVPIDATGQFRIQDCAAGHYHMDVVLPSAPRTGVPIRMPAGTVVLTKRDASIELDATELRVATVTGKVTVTGARVAEGRIALVFSSQSGAPGEEFRHRFRGQRWVVPERDGQFRIEVAPGLHDAFLVDVATGIYLHTPKGSVIVDAGEQLRLDVEARVVDVAVTLRGDAMTVDLVDIDIPKWGTTYRVHVHLLEADPFGTPGTDAQAGTRSLRLLVPEGRVKLSARQAFVLRDEFGMSLEPPLLGKAEFQAIPGSMPTPVELRILPPNDR